MIRRFAFEDLKTGWKLAPVEFSERNLLVGLSGVGKSRIVDALVKVSRAPYRPPPMCSWSVELEVDGNEVVWEGQTAPNPTPDERMPSGFDNVFVKERVVWAGKVLLDAGSVSDSVLLDKPLPPMDAVRSSLATFRRADTRFDRLLYEFELFRGSEAPSRERRGRLGSRHQPWTESLEMLRSWPWQPFREKVSILQRVFPERFQAVVDRYCEAFPTVQAVRVEFDGPPDSIEGGEWRLEVREYDVRDWIPEDALSSGMHRALLHFFELELLPEGSVLFVDEVETSLGMNCVAAVSDALWNQRARDDIQVIATSHHPYILNTIPRSDWKVVTREGSVVTVTPASEIPELATRSAQDSFTLLQRYYDRAQDTALRLVP